MLLFGVQTTIKSFVSFKHNDISLFNLWATSFVFRLSSGHLYVKFKARYM